MRFLFDNEKLDMGISSSAWWCGCGCGRSWPWMRDEMGVGGSVSVRPEPFGMNLCAARRAGSCVRGGGGGAGGGEHRGCRGMRPFYPRYAQHWRNMACVASQPFPLSYNGAPQLPIAFVSLCAEKTATGSEETRSRGIAAMGRRHYFTHI